MALQGIISVTCRRQAQVRWLSLMQQRVLLKEIMLGIQANPSRDMWFFNPKRVVRLPYPDRDWVAPTKCFAKLLKGQTGGGVESFCHDEVQLSHSVGGGMSTSDGCLPSISIPSSGDGAFAAHESSVFRDRPDRMVLEGGGKIEEPQC